MGCFSFLCKKTGKGVRSTSFSGEGVHLFLLKNGKVIEKMHGNYDSYGCVFDNKDNSFEWKMDWNDVYDLMFDFDKSNGIAAILDTHWKDGDPYPIERSKSDPNQGWGEGNELIEVSDDDRWKRVENPIHEIFH